MKAIQIEAFGDVDVLQPVEIERPIPQAGEVLVHVYAAGVNPVDTVSRKMPIAITTAKKALPYILGWDIAGEVVALGKNVTTFAIGDKVYGMPRFPDEAKAYSEYVVAPVADLARKPQNFSFIEAAGVPLAALTAWQGLFETGHLEAGQTVLITAGSGGVGHYAVQLAKWKGARVIATTSTRNKEFVHSLGADVVIDYSQQAISEISEPVDLVLDSVGEDTLRDTFKVVKKGGHVISLPGHKGVHAIGDELAGPYGVRFTVILVHPSGEQMAELTTLAEAGQLRTEVDSVFPLQETAQAHQRSESGRVRGKVVISIP